MTWLPIDMGSRPERDAVFGLKPEPYAVLREILEISFQITDQALLDLCRLRLAQLMRARAELAGVDTQRLARLADWHRSPGVSELERAALAFTEQYQIDHHGVTDEQKDDLTAQLSERGMVNFVWALHMNDAYIRALSLLDIAPDPPGTARPERHPSETAPASARPRAPGAEPELDDLRDPRFAATYSRLNMATVRQSLVDDVTSEAIRLRNAHFQGCQY
jgi:hypothetical protein